MADTVQTPTTTPAAAAPVQETNPAAVVVPSNPFDFEDPNHGRELPREFDVVPTADATAEPAATPPPAVAASAGSTSPAAVVTTPLAAAIQAPVVDQAAIQRYIQEAIRAALPPAPPPPATPPPAAPAEFQLSLDEAAGYDPNIVAAIKGIHEHYGRELKALKEQFAKVTPTVETIARQNQQQQVERDRSDFDGWLASLGDEFTEVLGKEPVTKLAKDSPQMTARIELLQEIDAIIAGYVATGRTPPSKAEAFNKALRSLHGDRSRDVAAQRAREQAAQQVRDRNGQFTVAKPTQRNGIPPSGDQAAVSWINSFLKEHNVKAENNEKAGLL